MGSVSFSTAAKSIPGLYLDIFQKIKALGYTGVSFYINWALLEGQEGVFNADGIFDL